MTIFTDAAEAEPDYSLKIVVVGDAAVGKSNVLVRWSRNEFQEQYNATIGVEFATKTLIIDGKMAQVHVWDTAGQEQYRSLAGSYYRGAVGALIVYDVTSASSFNSVASWIDQVKMYCKQDVTYLLVGNKSDLEETRCITQAQGISRGKELGVSFIETSAKSGSRIDEAFETIVADVIRSSNLHSPATDETGRVIANGPGIAVRVRDENDKKDDCC